MRTKRLAISLLLLSLLSLACVLAQFLPPTSSPIPRTPTFSRGIQDPASGHHYFTLPAADWYTSVTYCAALGGHLVTINNAAEDKFVYTNLYLANPGALLGATDEGHEGTWSWTNGEKMEYTNWSKGEPNNCGDLETNGKCVPENFLSYHTDDSDKWDDVSLKGTGHFICEFED